MRNAILIMMFIFAACSGDEVSVRQRFLAQAAASVQFETWARVINNLDRDSLALLYRQVDELRVLNPDGSVARGWDEAKQNIDKFLGGAEFVNFVTDRLEIDVRKKDLVLTTFRYTLDVQRNDGSRDPTTTGLGTIVWLKDPLDELWRIHLLHLASEAREPRDL